MRFVCVDGVPVELTTARVDVELVELDPASALPDITSSPEDQDDRDRQHRREESLSVVELAIVERWGNGDVELVE